MTEIEARHAEAEALRSAILKGLADLVRMGEPDWVRGAMKRAWARDKPELLDRESVVAVAMRVRREVDAARAAYRAALGAESTPPKEDKLPFCDHCKRRIGHFEDCPSMQPMTTAQAESLGSVSGGVTVTSRDVVKGSAIQWSTETPARHFLRCGPVCEHVTCCEKCADSHWVCDEHRSNPDASFAWKDGPP